MTTSRVLKVPQSDNDKEFVLLQASSSGKKPLDLKLIGTEGEAPYVVKVKHDRISALKVKNSPLTDAEWEATLLAFFNQEPLNDINAAATVQSEASISITIRKQVEGISQRLGTINLSHDANEAIELLEWCAASADAVVASKEATAQAQSKTTELEAAIGQLKDQLDELLRAKDEDETALLQKFRDLLNEKKVKIREQQKIMASGSFVTTKPVEPEAPSPEPEPEAPKSKGRGRKPAASRASKRKAAAPAKEESDEEDAQVPHVADEPRIKSEPEDTDDGNTTEATASVDGDDDSDEEMVDGEEEEQPAPAPAAPEPNPPKKVAAPPPKRDLPFVNRKPKAAPKLVPVGGDETDSDDEL
ncbi:hypothetical protein NLG97_g7117 [Lecanicillium saksenae]|uniref:Uncharacterized protein n=1 Tax=Lecanicillium saksenae TaxID=468837 RepID=A0ACC1QPJ5_9HYPO|nr:hypothetical protein NLG97_g7117 [Lecanicillium saksenae]